MKKKISTDQAPQAIGPYSQAIQFGSLLFVSGQIPLDPKTGNLLRFFLGHTGQLREAHSLLSQALADRSSNSARPRLRARTLADLADLSPQLGEYAQASHCLAQANHLYLENRFHADFGEFNLITNAKLDRERDLRRAQWLVRTANSSLQNSQHLMGLARALLLEARLADDGQNESRHLRLLQLKDQRPDLQNCPHLRKILAHWNSWTQGAGIEDETDFFWRL